MTAGNALIIGKDLSNGFTREITTPWPTHRRRPLRTDPWPLICRKSTDVQFLFNDALNIPCNAILEASINVDAVYYYIAARMLSALCFTPCTSMYKNFGDIGVWSFFFFREKDFVHFRFKILQRGLRGNVLFNVAYEYVDLKC